MLTVGPVGAPATKAAGTGRTRSGSGFEIPAHTSRASAASAAAALGAFLGEDGDVRDRQARRHGKALLAALTELQLALLGNAAQPDTLQRLSELSEACPDAATPALQSVLHAISLRAKIELARFGM